MSVRFQFLEAITLAFRAYRRYGARSNKKLLPIHTWLSNEINKNTKRRYLIRSLGNGGEYEIDGKYYPKRVDIAVFKHDSPIATVSFRFVTSNYAQNSNNYFENLLGESANIRRMNIGFAHFLVLRAHTPYYKKTISKRKPKKKKPEKLSNHHIEKYIKLFKDLDFPHKPEVLGIEIIDFKENKAYFPNLGEIDISKENIKIIKEKFSLEIFLRKFSALCRLKD